MRFFINKPAFFSHLLIQSEPQLRSIYNHPFNQGLFTGNLDVHIFRHYLLNDIYYLSQFQKAITTMMCQNKGLPVARVFQTLSDMIGTEEAMHDAYRHFYDTDEIKYFKPDACILPYCDFIRGLEQAPLLVQLSGLAPCLWTYRCLPVKYSQHLRNDAHLYQDWVETYHAPAFVGITSALVMHINTVANGELLETKSAAKDAFKKGTAFELAFYDEVFYLHSPQVRIRD